MLPNSPAYTRHSPPAAPRWGVPGADAAIQPHKTARVPATPLICHLIMYSPYLSGTNRPIRNRESKVRHLPQWVFAARSTEAGDLPPQLLPSYSVRRGRRQGLPVNPRRPFGPKTSDDQVPVTSALGNRKLMSEWFWLWRHGSASGVRRPEHEHSVAGGRSRVQHARGERQAAGEP